MYFSVKAPTKIMGKVYTPCVCYPVPDVLLPTVEKLVKEEKAYLFEEKVAFQNGKVLVKSVAKEEKTVEKPRKEKKTKEVPVKDTEELAEEAEIVPTAEDEGF